MRTVKLRIDTHGKYPRYGPNVYEVGVGSAVLARAGWQLIRRNQLYTYMRAPEGQETDHPVVEVTIPEREEVLALACEVHAKGRPWRGEVGGWTARYDPERHDYKTDLPAVFFVGEYTVWHSAVSWEHEAPDYSEDTDRLVPA
jgi:hypothetical protein